MDTEEEKVHVKYMQPSSKFKSLYEWPSREDASWENQSHVLLSYDVPVYDASRSTNRHQFFGFEPEQLQRAQNLFMAI